MRKILLALVAVIAIGFAAQAQYTERPWLIGVSTNYVDFNAVEQSVGDQFTDSDWMGKTLPGMIRVGRNLNKSFNASALFATVKTEPGKMNLIPLERNIASDQFYKLGVQLEYKFANDYILKESSWFDPYVFLGMNGSAIDDLTYLSSSMGVGFNIWFIDPLGINFQGSYDYNYDFNDYMHYSAGIVFRFGKKNDMDGDGVNDKNDLCPEQAGLIEFMGCPDTDGDGISDNEDDCPRIAGVEALNGCPDTDGDGIADKDDQCPTTAGSAEFNGCPDSDGDGIIDKNDRCPDVAGVAAFAGCPDTDGDGIPDNRDECPQEVGPADNNGCPRPIAPPVEVEEQLTFNAKQIQFETSSAKIMGTSTAILNEIVKIMNEYPEARFAINGYTDNSGPAEFNLKLSQERADAVKKFLTGKNISTDRIEAKGFGEANPEVSNDTKEGRAQNRRVEVKLIK